MQPRRNRPPQAAKTTRMKMIQRRAALAVALAAAALVTLRARPAQAQDRPIALLSDAATTVIDAPGDKLAVARRRTIEFSPAGLDALRRGLDLRLNLFADVSLPVLVDQAWRSSVDTWNWQGHVPGEPARSVILVLHKGRMWGTIYARSVGDFRFRSHRNLGQVVEEINQSNFLPCGCGVAQSQGNRPALQLPAAPARDEGGIAGTSTCPGPIIDVMVVYSPETAIEEGGTAAMEALIVGIEAATNVSYLNSLVSQRISVVHMAQTGSELTGFNATLNALTNDGDGNYDEVHTKRNQYGADMVAMLISHTNGGICGIAWLMGDTEIDPSFEQYAFSVTNTGCATGGFTFQHELGHNMGCHHDHDNAGGSPAFPWSYGHRFDGNDAVQYRTIMSYAPGTRISHFSNPNVLYQGQPTGVPQGTPLTQADNAASLNATASVVASFRDAVMIGATTWPPPNLLSAGDPDGGDRFGTSVAIDGDLAVIGAYTDDEAGTDAGAAYILKFNAVSGFWEQETKLLAPDAAGGDRFGISVDIIDGADDLAVIGAYLDDDAGADSGSAYVFRRVGSGSWAFEHKIKSTDLAGGDTFGRSVAIASYAGGDLVCAGVPNDDDGGNASGSAYVFRKVGAGSWTQEAKLIAADDAANDNFGQGVDIEVAPNGDQYAIAGNWHDDDIASNAGSAYVFRKVGPAAWTQLPKLVASDAAVEDQAGFVVALAFPDASTTLAMVGAWKANAPASNTGAAYAFADTGLGFVEETKLVASDVEAEANFGVAIDASVDEVIIGAYTDDAGALDAGAAYIYRRDLGGASWTEEAKLEAPTPMPNDQMGFAVTIDGARALAGAWQVDGPGGAPLDVGGVWLSGGSGGPPPTIDCNENGIDDDCDVSTGTSADDNENGIPDECEAPPCPADTNDDNAVDVNDLLAVITNWGPCVTPPVACTGDISPSSPPAPSAGDGQVDVNDLLLVITSWGICP